MISLLLSSSLFAAPLTCKELQSLHKEEAPHVIHRKVQQQGIAPDVPTCLQRKNLQTILPASDADLIAPNVFFVHTRTTKGTFLIHVQREWAPLGADRFYTLVSKGYFEDLPFFRVIRGFMAQFGIHNDPLVRASWKDKQLSDDPQKQSNTRGTISFATSGPNTRTTQLFVNTSDNTNLDASGFTPIGSIVHTPSAPGMNIVDTLFSGYGEGHPSGRGPSQALMQSIGNDFIKEHYPHIDFIVKMTVCDHPNPIKVDDCVRKP